MSVADLATIAASERSVGVTALSSYWPCLELLAKAGSAELGDREAAIAALRRLVVHCANDANGECRMRIAADEEVLLARGLFGEALSHRLHHHAAMSELASDLAHGGVPAVDTPAFADLLKIGAHVAESEAEFARNMDAAGGVVSQAMTAQGLDRRSALKQILDVIAATDTLCFLARTRVLATAKSLGIVLLDSEVEAYGQRVLEAFPVAIAVMRLLLAKAVEGGVNWRRSDRANSLWDLKLAVHASRGATIDGNPVLLVTDDDLLHAAARDARHEVFVVSKPDYLSMLSKGEVPQRRAAMLALAA
jgi:hypothetical protein